MQRQTSAFVLNKIVKPLLRGGLRLIVGLLRLGWKGASALVKLFAAQWARSPARAAGGAALVLLIGYGLYWSLLHESDKGAEYVGTPGPARSFGAQPATREEQLGQAITGFMFFILFHELGHGLVDVLQLPVVGPEENVVDEFAAITLISLGREGGIGPQIATIAAVGFARMWASSRGQAGHDITKLPYWDEHPLEIQRFYNLVCLVYGSAPEQFARLLEVVPLPETRAQRCVVEYQKKAQAWAALLSKHLRSPGQAPLPCTGPAASKCAMARRRARLGKPWCSNGAAPRPMKPSRRCSAPSSFCPMIST
jgi:hypothetical protein